MQVLTNKFVGIPIFAAIMFRCILHLSVNSWNVDCGLAGWLD